LLQRSPVYLTTDDQYTTTIKLRVSAESYDTLLLQNNTIAKSTPTKTEVINKNSPEKSENIPSKPKDDRIYYFMSLRYSKFVGFISNKDQLKPRTHPIPWVT
jgi:hypothetical protein